jgi:hypothetical protein
MDQELSDAEMNTFMQLELFSVQIIGVMPAQGTDAKSRSNVMTSLGERANDTDKITHVTVIARGSLLISCYPDKSS